MTVQTVWERAKVEGKDLIGYVQRVLEQGNARRIVIKQKGRTVVEFPLTVGVIGAVLAPMLAAVGAIAALATECTVEIERPAAPAEKSKSSGATKRTRRTPKRK